MNNAYNTMSPAWDREYKKFLADKKLASDIEASTALPKPMATGTITKKKKSSKRGNKCIQSDN